MAAVMSRSGRGPTTRPNWPVSAAEPILRVLDGNVGGRSHLGSVRWCLVLAEGCHDRWHRVVDRQNRCALEVHPLFIRERLCVTRLGVIAVGNGQPTAAVSEYVVSDLAFYRSARGEHRQDGLHRVRRLVALERVCICHEHGVTPVGLLKSKQLSSGSEGALDGHTPVAIDRMKHADDLTPDELDQLAQSLAIDGSLGRADTLLVVDV